MSKFINISLSICLLIICSTQALATEKVKSAESALLTTQSAIIQPVLGQKVTVNYKLAVDGYFNGASSFQLPSLSKARLAQSSNFAINGSEFINGKQYATQLWQIDITPEQTGLLEIPALTFNIQYMDDKGIKQKKSLRSDILAMFVNLPEPLRDKGKYVVSSDLQLYDAWSENELQYQVGDVISRELVIEVADITAVQIPELIFKPINGIKINIQEAKLQDQRNRGVQSARLTQQVNYIIQKPGSYQLGGEQLLWWHLEEGVQQTQFEPLQLDVAGLTPLMLKVSTVTIIFILLFVFIYFKFKKMLPSLKSQLQKALKDQQWQLLIALLYQQADLGRDLALLKKGPHKKTSAQLLQAFYQQEQQTPEQSGIKVTKLKELIK